MFPFLVLVCLISKLFHNNFVHSFKKLKVLEVLVTIKLSPGFAENLESASSKKALTSMLRESNFLQFLFKSKFSIKNIFWGIYLLFIWNKRRISTNRGKLSNVEAVTEKWTAKEMAMVIINMITFYTAQDKKFFIHDLFNKIGFGHTS